MDALRVQWLAEEKIPFQGWDFSYIEGRMEEEAVPWDYMGMAAAHMAHATALLTVGASSK